MKNRKRALILFSHGSKRASWSRPFEEMKNRCAPRLAHSFEGGVHLAFLEGRGPYLEETAELCLESGCQEILVFPLFLTASTHLQEDVPEAIASIEDLCSRRNATVNQVTESPLSEHIWTHTIERIREHGLPPKESAVVLPYYGSDRFAAQWETLLDTARSVLEQGGFGPIIPSPVGHIVHGSPDPTTRAIIQGLEDKEYCAVLPMLLSPGVFQNQVIPQAIENVPETIRSRIRYTPDGILPDPHVEEWVIQITENSTG